MVKAQAKPIFRLLLTLCFIFSCFCFAGEQEPQYDNLSFGVPGRADTIIDRPGYALGYIEYHEQPAWVIYIMTKAEATTKVAKRTNKFRSDPEIPTGSATTGDYRRSGYDRGHLAPAADMAFSGQTMADSFFMSNMSPQKPAFNRGIGKDLEALVRYFAKFISGIWQIHPFREGNTRTTAVFAIKYLRAMGFTVNNDLFSEYSWYFRNALVRANYRNYARCIEPEFEHLEKFFRHRLDINLRRFENIFLG